MGNEISSGLNLFCCGITVGQRDRIIPASHQHLHKWYQWWSTLINGKLHPGLCRKPRGKLCLVKSPGCERCEAHRPVTTMEPARHTPHSRLKTSCPCPYQVLSITSWPKEAPQQLGNCPKNRSTAERASFPTETFLRATSYLGDSYPTAYIQPWVEKCIWVQCLFPSCYLFLFSTIKC